MRQRIWYLDVLRVISILLVLFNHTDGFMLGITGQESSCTLFYVAFSNFVRVAVPIFFMISGALLLGKDEPVHTVVKKRAGRVLVALLVASLVNYVWQLVRDASLADFSFPSFLLGVYTCGIAYPLWFLYAYLAYVLTLPLMRKIAQGLTRAEWRLFFFAFAFLTCLPILDIALFGFDGPAHTDNLSSYIVEWVFFYPLLGYYLDRVLDEDEITLNGFLALLAGALACLVVGVLTTQAWYANELWDTTAWRTFICTSLTALPAAALFYGMRLLYVRFPLGETANKVLTTLGGATFGIFLLEPIYRESTRPVFEFLTPYLPAFLACWAWVLCAWVAGTAVTLILKRIPGVKKIL